MRPVMPPSKARDELQAEYGAGNVFDTRELAKFFVLIGFHAPVLVAVRKSDGVRGYLRVQFEPAFFYGFEPEQPDAPKKHSAIESLSLSLQRSS